MVRSEALVKLRGEMVRATSSHDHDVDKCQACGKIVYEKIGACIMLSVSQREKVKKKWYCMTKKQLNIIFIERTVYKVVCG